MGISFADIVEKSRKLAVTFDGDKVLNITYDPSSLSPAKISKMNKELTKEDEDVDLYAVARMFCSVVTEWDLTGPLGEGDDGTPVIPEGQPVPVVADNVAWLPSPILSHIIAKVGEDAAPKGKKQR